MESQVSDVGRCGPAFGRRRVGVLLGSVERALGAGGSGSGCRCPRAVAGPRVDRAVPRGRTPSLSSTRAASAIRIVRSAGRGPLLRRGRQVGRSSTCRTSGIAVKVPTCQWSRASGDAEMSLSRAQRMRALVPLCRWSVMSTPSRPSSQTWCSLAISHRRSPVRRSSPACSAASCAATSLSRWSAVAGTPHAARSAAIAASAASSGERRASAASTPRRASRSSLSSSWVDGNAQVVRIDSMATAPLLLLPKDCSARSWHHSVAAACQSRRRLSEVAGRSRTSTSRRSTDDGAPSSLAARRSHVVARARRTRFASSRCRSALARASRWLPGTGVRPNRVIVARSRSISSMGLAKVGGRRAEQRAQSHGWRPGPGSARAALGALGAVRPTLASLGATCARPAAACRSTRPMARGRPSIRSLECAARSNERTNLSASEVAGASGFAR